MGKYARVTVITTPQPPKTGPVMGAAGMILNAILRFPLIYIPQPPPCEEGKQCTA